MIGYRSSVTLALRMTLKRIRKDVSGTVYSIFDDETLQGTLTATVDKAIK